MTKPNDPVVQKVEHDFPSGLGGSMSVQWFYSGGLTKREYFAAMALLQMVADVREVPPPTLARMAVETADALIAELNK